MSHEMPQRTWPQWHRRKVDRNFWVSSPARFLVDLVSGYLPIFFVQCLNLVSGVGAIAVGANEVNRQWPERPLQFFLLN